MNVDKRLAYAIFRDVGMDLEVEVAALAPGGPAVKTLVAGELAITYSCVGPEFAAPTPKRVEHFASVVATLHRSRPVLPLRYGLLNGEAELRSRLLARKDVWLARLDAVAGCEEMGLRFLPTAGPAPVGEVPIARSAGAAYLAARREKYARQDAMRVGAEAATARALDALAPLASEVRVEPSRPSRGALASLAFLVPRDRLDRFREAARGLQAGDTERILLTGPWPPYHFAEPLESRLT